MVALFEECYHAIWPIGLIVSSLVYSHRLVVY